MKSKVLKMYPYQQVDITPFRRSPDIDQAALQKEMDRVVYPYITWSDGDTVYAGDVAECSLTSDDPRYQRSSVKITVGVGLLDREAEKLLVGLTVGSKRKVTCRGSEVEVTIQAVKNRHVPSLTDAMVAALGIEGVSTVEQYRTDLLKKALDERFQNESYEVVQYVLKEVAERSEILIDQQDWEQSVAWDLGRLDVIAGFEGMELKTMTAQDFQGRIPVTSYGELVAMLQRDAWNNTRQMLLGRELAKTDGFAVTQEDYEVFLAELAANWNSTVEAYRPAYPFAYYEAIQYRNHYYHAVTNYLRKVIYWEES